MFFFIVDSLSRQNNKLIETLNYYYDNLSFFFSHGSCRDARPFLFRVAQSEKGLAPACGSLPTGLDQ